MMTALAGWLADLVAAVRSGLPPGLRSRLPPGLVTPLVVGLAVVVWPGSVGSGARRRLARLTTRAASTDPTIDLTPARIGRFGRLAPRAGGPPWLGADVVMELVACGLRAGLSVADALACATAVAGGTDPAAQDDLDPPVPTSAGPRHWPRRRVRDAPADSAYLVQVVSRLRLGASADEAWARPPPDLVSLARALQLAELSGAPAAAVVSRAATDLRARVRERTELAAARLGVRLVLPLGLAVLPGFVLLAVAPIVLGLATSVLQSAG
jgi:hypothetical protein